MAEMRREIKDSVFTYLFRQPEYTRQLYLALHPEDSDITEQDCKIVTLENIITNGMYNDVGIQVRDKLLLLVEAQSTFSKNLSLRLLLYLAASYNGYVVEHKLDLYATKPVSIPRPELYVVYTGEKKDIPDTIKLSELYGGNGSTESTVKVLRGGDDRDIISQYVRFCKITDEQRKKYDYTPKAIDETIRICLEENILVPFLQSRQKEVTEMMVTLFDKEQVQEIHDYNIRQEGVELGIEAFVSSMKEVGAAPETIIEKLVKKFKLPPDTAEKKYSQYSAQ